MAIIPGDQATASFVSSLTWPRGRLSLDENDPTPITDQLAKTTLYYVVQGGPTAPLVDVTAGGWIATILTGISLSIAGYGSGEILDIFGKYTGGTASLEALTWGTAAANKGLAITDASNATPIVITANGHGLTSGAQAYISGVGGNTAANGWWQVTYIDLNTFSLNGSVGNGAYTSGGYLSARDATNLTSVSWGGGITSKTPNALTRYINSAGEVSIYLGTVKLSAAGQVEDSQSKRFVWNAFNRVLRPLKRTSGGNLEFVTGAGEAIMGTVDGANSLTMLPSGYGYVACSASGMLGVWG